MDIINSTFSRPNQEPQLIRSDKPRLTENSILSAIEPKRPILTGRVIPMEDDIPLLSNSKKSTVKPKLEFHDDDIPVGDEENDEITVSTDRDEDNDEDDDDVEEESYETESEVTEEPEPEPEPEKLSYEQILEQKQHKLCGIRRLEKMGIKPARNWTMASDLNDLQMEYKRMKYERDVDKSIDFQRKLLIGFVKGIEKLNGTFNPIDAKLDGWSKNVMADIHEYDEIFEELYLKYGNSLSAGPEIRLVTTLGLSAFFYHMSHSLSQDTDIADILKRDPRVRGAMVQALSENVGGSRPGPSVGGPSDINSLLQELDGRSLNMN